MQCKEVKELNISEITLGTVQLGLDYGMNNIVGKPSESSAFEMLKKTFDGGVTCIDTARDYGDSEEVIGRFFAKNPEYKNNVTVTKFKINPDKGTDKESIENQIRDYAFESLRRLNLDCIPIYLLHNAGDMTAYGDAVSNTLIELKKEGIIKIAGVSVYNAEEIDIMLDNPIYEAVQLPLNVFDQRLIISGHLAKLHKAGIIVFVRSVFLQGMFFADTLPQKYAIAQPYLDTLKSISKELGISTAELAVAFVRGLHEVTSLVLGAETTLQIEDNMRIIDTHPLTEATIVKLKEFAKDVPIQDIMTAILGK